MKKIQPQPSVSARLMHLLRNKLRMPVTVLMLGCNLTWTVQSHGEVLIKTNSGASTFLAPTSVLPGTNWVQGRAPTTNDILGFDNSITAASNYRISNLANAILAVDGLKVVNPAGAITLQNNTNQTQTLRLGAGGIDMSRATQNLILSNASGGTLRVELLAPQTWSVAQGRTLQILSAISGTGTGLTINPGLNGLGGTVDLRGANTFTGATTVNNAALILDYGSAAARIHSGSSLNLNRGTVTIQGSSTYTQAVTGLNLGAGLNQILRGGSTASINVGAINRTSPTALLNVGTAGFVTTSTGNGTGGILGGWAVVNNSDWAVGGGAITAFSGYTALTSSWTGTSNATNASIGGNISNVSGAVNSLKFAHATATTAMTFTLSSALNVTSGGILRNQNAATTITGGSLTAGGTADGSADFLYLWNNSNTMTVSSNIVNNGADVVGLVKAGAGEVVLSASASTYTGSTTVANGRLSISNANAINKAGDIAIFGNSGTDNTGSFQWNTSTAATLTGNITGGAGTDALRHTLRKLTSGVLTLTPAVANTYYGSTLIDAGILRAGNTTAFSPNSRYQFSTTANTALDLAGFNNTVRGLSGGGVSGGHVTLGSGTLTLQTLEGDALSYAGIISGTGGITKAGAGVQTLTANQTFTGAVTVTDGTLNTAALSATQLVVNAGSTLRTGNLTGNPSISLNGDAAQLQLINGVSPFISALNSQAGSSLVFMTGGASNTLTFNDNGGATTVTRGVITMSDSLGAGLGHVVKNGSNNWELAGGNAYTGNTTVNGGQLIVSSSALVEVLPDTTALSLANAAGVALVLNGHNETIGSLSGGGSTGGHVNLGAGTLTLGQDASSVYAGVVSGSGGLTKLGQGDLSLTGGNTFTGELRIMDGSVSLNRAAGGTLASGASVVLAGTDSRLNVGGNQTLSRLTAGAGSEVNIANGATLTTGQASAVAATGLAVGDADTRIIKLSAPISNLRAGMTVSGGALPAGAYITQVISDDQILINTGFPNFAETQLTFGEVEEIYGSLSGSGNWTKTGTGGPCWRGITLSAER